MNKILAENGWVIECESPLEIRHSDGSFASNNAARIIINSLTPIIKSGDDCEDCGSCNGEDWEWNWGNGRTEYATLCSSCQSRRNYENL